MHSKNEYKILFHGSIAFANLRELISLHKNLDRFSQNFVDKAKIND